MGVGPSMLSMRSVPGASTWPVRRSWDGCRDLLYVAPVGSPSMWLAGCVRSQTGAGNITFGARWSL